MTTCPKYFLKILKALPSLLFQVYNRCFFFTSKVHLKLSQCNPVFHLKLFALYLRNNVTHFYYFLEIRISKLHCGMKSKVHVNIVHLRSVIIVQGLLTNFAARNWNIWFRSWMEWNKLLMIIKWKWKILESHVLVSF